MTRGDPTFATRDELVAWARQRAREAEPTIYHGTPLTPRAALSAVLPGRAACVSFWRPDDVEAVEAVCPQVMFRQRRLFGMDGCVEARGTVVHPRGLDTVLRVAGAAPVHAGAMGSDTGRTGSAVPAQRQSLASMALRSLEGCAALAHGRADRTLAASVRAIRPGLPWLDRRGHRAGLRSMVPADGRSGRRHGQPLARSAHDARGAGRPRIPVLLSGCEQRRAERVAL